MKNTLPNNSKTKEAKAKQRTDKGSIRKTFKFKSKVSVWNEGNFERTDDSSQWRFARVPEDISAKIKDMQKGRLRRGWGAVYARAKVGKSEWLTSVFPVPGFSKTGIPAPKRDLGNWHSATYILPLKKQIRFEENLYDGIPIKVTIEVWF